MPRRSVLLALLLAPPAALGAQDPAPAVFETGEDAGLLLQRGLYLELAACDLEAAARTYRKVLLLRGAPEETLALAKLRLGATLRLLGRPSEAQRLFQEILERHTAQREIADAARRHLGTPAEVQPARYLPPNPSFYLELVHPAEQAERLRELVRGTPFQNPLDYTRPFLEPATAAAAGRPAGRPGAVERAAAVLNRGFLNELGKLGGVAFAVPGDADPQTHHLLVLFPGRSDILRGLVTATLAVRRPAALAGSVPIYDLGPDATGLPAFVAYGGDVVIWGRPRELVVEAVRRGLGEAPSLAGDRDFLEAQSLRTGSALFAYAGGSWRKRLFAALEEKGDPGLQALARTFEVERLYPLAATLAVSEVSDSLLVALHAGLKGEEASALWAHLKTRPLDPKRIEDLPPGTIAWFAMETDRAFERVLALRKAAAQVLAGIPAEKKGDVEGLAAVLDALLALPECGRFLGEVEAVVAGLAQEEEPGASGAGGEGRRWIPYLRLAVRDDSKAAGALGSLLTRTASTLFRTKAAETLHTRIGDGGTTAIRWVEPLPAKRLGFAAREGLILIAPDLEFLARALRPGHPPPSTAIDPPPGASKVLYLGQPALIRALNAADPHAGSFFSPVKHILLYTREGDRSVSLELEIPSVTEAARSALERLARSLEEPEDGAGGR